MHVQLSNPTPERNDPVPRTPREQRLQRLFVVWMSMGTGRSLGAVAKKEGIPVRELIAHAKRFNWQARATEILRSADEKAVDGELVEAIANVNSKHIEELTALRRKAIEFLERCAFDKPSDAIKAMLESIKLEREIRGLNEKGKDGEVGEVLKQLVQGLDLIPAETVEFEFKEDFEVDQLPEPDDDETPALPEPSDED